MAPASPSWTDEARARVAAARVARLATVRPDGTPHLVAVTFALDGDTVVTAVDDKPKTTHALTRLANIKANPAATLLVDHYEEEWRHLWWVRLDGDALVVRDEPRRSQLIEPLVAKYEHYTDAPPRGAVIALTVRTVSAWSAAP